MQINSKSWQFDRDYINRPGVAGNTNITRLAAIKRKLIKFIC